MPVLAEVPLFQHLSRRQLKRVASLARTRRFANGAPIVRAGDAGSAFYVLVDGAARIVTPSGRSRRLKAGGFFGEMALFDDSPRSADVLADGEVLTLTISRSAFGKLLRSEPAIAHEFLRTLASRLRAAEKAV
jgi:CRP-like cAMP-binding protein